jgi:hypothetical protein
MLNLLKVLLIFLGLLKFSPPLWAADFTKEIEKLAASCSKHMCKDPYAKVNLYQHPAPKELFPLLKTFEAIAFEHAQIWGDTILEGDYAADGKTRLDLVFALYKNSLLIGYLITYSEKAWDTSRCKYDGINNDTLVDCQPGRIIESVYLSKNFKEYYHAENTYADFQIDE